MFCGFSLLKSFLDVILSDDWLQQYQIENILIP